MRHLILLLALLSGLPVFSQKEPVNVVKSGKPIVLDGILDDDIWKTLPKYSDFTCYVPDFGSPVAFETSAFITYDEDYLYVAFDCKDPEPSKLKATITARDQIKEEDWVCINFDPFFDQQSMICIYVNPLGIQMDTRSTATKEDVGADYVFETKATIQSDGYQVEIAVPFKSLRYSSKDPVNMGFIFERRIQRLSQQATSPALNPEQGMNFMIQTKGFSFSGIKHYTLMELLPAVTYSFRQTHEEGAFGIATNKPSFGLTGTVGITSQLILDMAVNPDFSQVESDAGQISENQRYALYYSEKRPFFQEGKGIFDIAATSEHGFFQQAFHTRQIVNPFAGVKLTGKIGERDRIGFLYALDDPFENHDGDTSRNWIHYAIGRWSHSFRDDSYIGAITTLREGAGIYNRVGGFDGRWRLNPSTKIEFNSLVSRTVAGPGETSGTDWMGSMKLSKNTDHISGDLSIQHIGPGFITQSGFLTRAGVNNLSTNLSYSFYRNHGFIRRVSPMLFLFLNQDIPSDLWERDLGVGITITGQRSSQVMFFFNPSDEVYRSERFRTHSLHASFSSQVIQSVRIQGEYRFGYSTRYIENPFTGYGNSASISLNFQPLKKFQSDLSVSYSDFFVLEPNALEFNYLILRSRNTFQLTSKLFIRGIVEYNSFEKDLSTDFLISFTYIPGTVLHLGYGSLYQKLAWNGHEYQPGSDYLETIRGFFFKASYLWRK